MQVSTSTGSLSHYYNLAIIVPRAYILGADEYYAMAGGDISLVCIIEDVRADMQAMFDNVVGAFKELICTFSEYCTNSTNDKHCQTLLSCLRNDLTWIIVWTRVTLQTLEPPQYVYWYHNDKIINYDTKRTRVSFDMGKVGTALGGCRCSVLCRQEQPQDEQPAGDSARGEGGQRELHLQHHQRRAQHHLRIRVRRSALIGQSGSRDPTASSDWSECLQLSRCSEPRHREEII